jgi:hypothetical protein
MLITSIEDFLKCIPTAEDSVWEDLEPFGNSADATIKALLVGSDLYDYIEDLEDGEDLKTTLCNLIAFWLYKNAIPFVDLIQTKNGFAVISNSNQAPASKERVERLILWCDQSIDLHTDLLIMQIMSDAAALAEWTKFGYFKTLTNCIFLTGIDFASYSKYSTRTDFLKNKPQLLAAQKNDLSEALSVDYVTELLSEIKTNSLTDINQQIVDSCKLVLVKYAEKEEHEAEELLNQIVVLMEKKLTDYPTYAASAEYALKIAPKYENKVTDPTFFFGM